MKVYIPPNANPLIEIILEPYTRKYGLTLINDGNSDYDVKTSDKTLDMEVHSIISEIFSGDGIQFPRKDDEYIYPLIKISNKQINDFFKDRIVEDTFDDASGEFLDFLDETVIQYKFNILKSVEYLEKNKNAD